MEITIKTDKKEYFKCSMYYMRKYFGLREIILLTLLLGIGLVLFFVAGNVFMLVLFGVSVGIILLALVLFIITGKGGYNVDMVKRGIVEQKLDFQEDALLVTNIDAKGNPIFIETHPYEKIEKVAIRKDVIYIYAQVSVFYYVVAKNYDKKTCDDLVDFLHKHLRKEVFKMKKTHRALPKKKKLTLEEDE